MMEKQAYEKLLKQALVLETQHRTEFLDSIEDVAIKQKLAKILSDETQVSEFLADPKLCMDGLIPKKIDDFKAGDWVEHFEIIELMAKGGMGCVYLAKDTKLKRDVALKTIRPEYLHYQINQQRFKQEAEILSQVNHPSICQIYDYIQTDDGDILVLELVKGKTLNQYKLNHQDIIAVVIQIASALEFAHKNNIVHRDLKPDNIMLTDENQVKVLDFGIAKSQVITKPHFPNQQQLENPELNPRLTKAGSLMGTLVYMSPEQAQGKEVGKASDIYSLAVIIQELLTNKAVYRLEDTEDLRQQVIHAQLIEIGKVPKECKKLIQWMTQIEPANRPDAHQVVLALHKIRDKPIRTRNKRILALVALIIVALMATMVWQKWQANRDKSRIQLKNQIEVDIAKLKNQLDFIFTLPKHNIDDKIAEVDNSRDAIIGFIQQQDILTQANKQQLIGTVYFANGDYYSSLKYLETAWESGIQEPELAQKLGYAYQVAFRDGFNTVVPLEQVSSDDLAKQRYEKSKLFFDFYAKNSQSTSWLIDSYKFYFAKDYQTALDLIRLEEAHAKGDFRVFNYLGLIYTDIMNQAYRDNDLEKTNEYYQKAYAAFKQSIDYARSFPIAYTNICNLNTQMIRAQIFAAGEVNQELLDNTTHYCHDAVEIAMAQTRLINQLASFYSGYAEYLISQGDQATDQLQQALYWNKKSLQQQETSDALVSQAIINDLLALQQYEAGQNPLDTVENALQAYQKAIQLDPATITNNTGNMFYSYMVKMKYQIAQGEYPIDSIQQAEQLFIAQESSSQKSADMFGNMYSNYGDLQRLMAKAALNQNQNQDLQTWLQSATNSYQKSLAAQVNMPYPTGGLAAVELLAAEWALSNNELNESQLMQLQQSVHKAVEIGANLNWIQWLQADFLRLQLQWQHNNKQTTEDLFATADAAYVQAIAMYPNDFDAHIGRAKLYLMVLQAHINKPQRQEQIELAQNELDYVLNIIPNHFEALALQQQLNQLKSNDFNSTTNSTRTPQ